MLSSLVLVISVAVVYAQDFNGGDSGWYCTIINNEDCMEHDPDELCGTDGKTYRNSCDLGQAHCADDEVNQQRQGPCLNAAPSTTQSPGGSPASTVAGGATATAGAEVTTMSTNETTTRSMEQIIHGSQIILDFQCALLSHSECDHAINEIICGTNGRTYADFCEYEKARCTHRDLHVDHLGAC